MALETPRRNSYFLQDRRYFLILMGPPFAIIFLLTIVPIAYSLVLSLWKMNLAMPGTDRFVGLGNYARMLTQDPNFWTIMRNTVVQVFGTVSLQIVIGLFLALLFAREARGMGVARSLFMVRNDGDPVVIGVIWRFMVNPEFRHRELPSLPCANPGADWLGKPGLAMTTIIAADVWLSTSFVTIIMIAGISSLPTEPFEAAKVDGASSFKAFIYITLPLLSPVIWVAVMFRLIDAFKRFDSIYIMTGGPGKCNRDAQSLRIQQCFSYLDTGYAASLAMFLFFIIALLSVVTIQRVRTSRRVEGNV